MGEWVWIQNVVRENNKFVAEVQLSYPKSRGINTS